MSSSGTDVKPKERRKTAPLQLGLTIVFAAMLAGLTVAGFLFGDDFDDVFDDELRTTERVQIQGYWMGMKLGPADEAAGTSGVTVLEISELYGTRARQAGIMPGDVLVSVNGKGVTTLSDLDAAAKSTKAASGLPVELQRWGQPMSVVIPPMPAMAQPGATPPANAYAPNNASQPAAWVPPQDGWPQPQPAAAWPQPAPQPAAAPMFYCPQHRVTFAQQHVHPHYRCPMCAGPVTPVR
jgi:hypothetical protein